MVVLATAEPLESGKPATGGQVDVHGPEGMVATYGQVALLAGRPRSARYVGYALHSNPRPGQIPCHRVVFADGRICEGFAFGGPDAQRELLMGEGVTFTDPMLDHLVHPFKKALRRHCSLPSTRKSINHHKGPVPFVVVYGRSVS